MAVQTRHIEFAGIGHQVGGLAIVQVPIVCATMIRCLKSSAGG
jgi:hypothetical protein